MPPRIGAFLVGAAAGAAVVSASRSGSNTVYVNNGSRSNEQPAAQLPPAYNPASSAAFDTNEPLPYGWEERKDDQGRTYYVNHLTSTTQWEDPRILPPGWEKRYDNYGRLYFANHHSRCTQWEDPRTQKNKRKYSSAETATVATPLITPQHQNSSQREADSCCCIVM
eukprot:Rmarinus@m.24683